MVEKGIHVVPTLHNHVVTFYNKKVFYLFYYVLVQPQYNSVHCTMFALYRLGKSFPFIVKYGQSETSCMLASIFVACNLWHSYSSTLWLCAGYTAGPAPVPGFN